MRIIYNRFQSVTHVVNFLLLEILNTGTMAIRNFRLWESIPVYGSNGDK